ncbi:glucosamine-6-phosphate deaminase [Candidatus Parcubacteria bacterium]|nr:glucosamine-6-phosphate deaminase [Candidatus Parcubacteria bacterium]
MKIIITKNKQLMSARAANIIIKQIKKKKSSVLVLPTGSTPLGMYKKLREARKKRRVNFKNVITFNLDEWVGVPHDHKASFYYYMRKNLFNYANIKPKNINILNGMAQNLKKECGEYEKLITKKKIDLAILGIGRNGHIAFNEPGATYKLKTRVVDLTLKSRRDNQKGFKSLRQVPKQGLTMGIYTIMQAKKIILLASGKDKAKIIAKALKGKVNKNIPASYLQLHPKVVVVLDKQAAGKL